MLINFTVWPPEGAPDETYTLNPPKGVCKNKLCPDRRVRHESLVRGYCEPCASIRVPPSDYRPARRLSPDDWQTIRNLTHKP